jgi:hypothetical protein
MLTLEVFRQTPEYIECSDKVRLWLVALVENGFDYTAATRTAFTAKDPVKYGHAVRNWPTVRAALAVYREMSAFDIWVADVQRASRRKNTTIAHIQALKLRADAMGWNAEGLSARLNAKPAAAIAKPQAVRIPPADPSAPKVFKVGDRVTERDEDGVLHVGIVRAVDASGQITDAEEFTS